MTRKRIIGLLGFGALAVLFIVYVLNSQAVLAWTVSKTINALPGKTHFTSVRGRLLGPVEIDGITHRNDEQMIVMDHLLLDWHPGALLYGQLHISQFIVDGTRISPLAQADQSDKDSSLFELDLPLPLVLEQGQFNKVSIQQLDSDTPIHLESIKFSGHAEADILSIESFAITAADYRVDVNGVISARGNYPLTLTLNWQTSLANINRLAGVSHLNGNLKVLHVNSVLTAPGGATFIGTLHDVLDDIHWQGKLTLDQFTIAQLADDFPPVTISGQGDTHGTLTKYAVSGQFKAKVPEAGDIVAVIDTTYQSGLVTIRQAKIDQLSSDMQVQLEGKLDVSKPQLTFDGKSQWRNFQWPLVGAPLLTSQRGRLHASGSIDAYIFALDDTTIVYQSVHADKVSIHGQGDARHITLQNLNAEVLNGKVKGGGSVFWAPEFHWQASIQGNGLNPGTLQEDWAGKLAIALSAGGRGTDKDFSLQANLSELDGVLRGQALKGHGMIKKDKQHFSISELNVNFGGASVIASGTVAENIDLSWNIIVPNLNVLHPSFDGEIKTSGRASGPRHRPTIVAELDGRDILLGKLSSVNEISAAINVDLLGQKHSTLQLRAQDIQYRNIRLAEAFANAKGNGAKNVINASVRHATESLDIAIVGELDKEVWSGLLQTTDIKSTSAGNWRLNKPARFSVSTNAANIEPFCWLDTNARFCGEADWHRQTGWRTAWEIDKLPLALLQPLFEPGIKLSGQLTGRAQLTAKTRQFTSADLDLSLGPGAMTYMQDETEVPILGFNSGAVRIVQSDKGIDGQMNMAFSAGGKLDAAVHLPGTDLLNTVFEDNTLQGHLNVNTHQLNIIRLFYRDLGELSGELISNLSLDGTLQQPRFAGHAAIHQASVTVPQLGLKLEDINVKVQGANDEQLRLSGSLKSGEGILTMAGEWEFDPRHGSPGRLRLQGKQLQVANLPEAKAVVSPDMEIIRKGRHIDINGQVEIPQASIKAVSLPANISVSRDVVFVDDLESEEERRARTTRLLVHSKVKVIVGDNVEFDGYGLRGELAGDIEVADEPGKATTGQGALHINDGSFRAFGVNLDVDLGRIIFTGGPVDDPGIDARATRKAGDVTAGVRISGRLRSPDISVFSIPSMPESEAMSYLLFGRVVRDTSFGADRLTQPGSGTDSGFGFGTYLSPRTYVDYLSSVLNPTSVLRVRFQLTDRWELHTESSSSHRAADAVFTFER